MSIRAERMGAVAFSFCTALPLRGTAGERLPRRAAAQPHGDALRVTPRCGSLEESKKRARSPYDNIPDLNQLYLRELSRVSDAKAYVKPGSEAPPESILRPPGVLSPSSAAARRRRRRVAAPDVPQDVLSEEEKAAARMASLSEYRALRATLLGDTLFIGALGVAAGWAFGDANTAGSVALGCVGSCAYVFLLSRGVDRLGNSGDSLAPARAAVLALLVVVAAKNKEVLQVLPVMMGFFSYKVATLLPLITGAAFEDAS